MRTVYAASSDEDRFRTSHDYVAQRTNVAFGDFEVTFDYILKLVGRFHEIGPETQIFEIGAGLGWFEILCARRGFSCSAIDHNPVIREAALDLARRQGLEVDITLGSVEETDLGRERYDIIIATSVFEHVRQYGRGLARVHEALRPGGVFFFYSTNKFSPRSGEYPDFPLYGWFPYEIRERIRVSSQGPGIVQSGGIDFNQFTYWGLVKHLKSLGYSRVLDRVDYLSTDDGSGRSATRTMALKAAKRFTPVKFAARAFAAGNAFICIK